MKEKLQNLGRYVQEYVQYAGDGLKEFSNNPVKYSSKALKDFVENYWDAGIAVASGQAFTPYGANLLGEYSLLVGAFGLIASEIGTGIRDGIGIKNLKDLILTRKYLSTTFAMFRNASAFAESSLIGIDINHSRPLKQEILMKLFEAFFLYEFISSDYDRRTHVSSKPISNQKTLEESL